MSTMGPSDKIERLYAELANTEKTFLQVLSDLTYRMNRPNFLGALQEYEQKHAKKPNTDFSSPDEIQAILNSLVALEEAINEFSDYLDNDKKELNPKELALKFQKLKAYFFQAGMGDLMKLKLPPSLLALNGLQDVNLNNVLITVAQRGPRYQMLLAEMLKYAPSSLEYQDLAKDFETAAHAAGDVATAFNLGQKKIDKKKITQAYAPIVEEVKVHRKKKDLDKLATVLVEEAPDNLEMVLNPLTDSAKRQSLILGLEKLAHIDDRSEKTRKAPLQHRLTELLLNVNQAPTFTPTANRRMAEFRTLNPAKTFTKPQRKHKENETKAGEPQPSKQFKQ